MTEQELEVLLKESGVERHHPTATQLIDLFNGEVKCGTEEERLIWHVQTCQSCMEEMLGLERADEAAPEQEE